MFSGGYQPTAFYKFGFVEFFDFAQFDSVLVGTGLPDGPQITLN